MYDNFSHIISKLKRFKELELYDEKSVNYLNQNKAGFTVSNDSVKFISTKRHNLNYDWELIYDEILAIVFEEKIIIDDEEQLLIFYRRVRKPIVFTIPIVTSEEMFGIENFIIKLNELFELEYFSWTQDKAIIAFPSQYKGKELYGVRKGIFLKIKQGFLRMAGTKFTPNGVFLNELKIKTT